MQWSRWLGAGVGAALLSGTLTGRAPAPAATSDTFQPVGQLIEARDRTDATLLADGTVLVNGGENSQDLNTAMVLASAELFDPATNQFTAVGPMTGPRIAQQSVRLQDGRVLITGGFDRTGGPGLGTAELYDPATHTFTAAAGQMVTGRAEHAAALLPDGRVLMAGGWVTGPSTLAEVFDPATGTFQATGSMRNARELPVAVALRDGRVAVLGGLNFGNGTPTAIEIYDPKTGTFGAGGALKEGRVFFTTTLLPDGRILVAGGQQPNASPPGRLSIEVYDPSTGAVGDRRDAARAPQRGRCRATAGRTCPGGRRL